MLLFYNPSIQKFLIYYGLHPYITLKYLSAFECPAEKAKYSLFRKKETRVSFFYELFQNPTAHAYCFHYSWPTKIKNLSLQKGRIIFGKSVIQLLQQEILSNLPRRSSTALSSPRFASPKPLNTFQGYYRKSKGNTNFPLQVF